MPIFDARVLMIGSVAWPTAEAYTPKGKRENPDEEFHSRAHDQWHHGTHSPITTETRMPAVGNRCYFERLENPRRSISGSGNSKHSLIAHATNCCIMTLCDKHKFNVRRLGLTKAVQATVKKGRDVLRKLWFHRNQEARPHGYQIARTQKSK